MASSAARGRQGLLLDGEPARAALLDRPQPLIERGGTEEDDHSSTMKRWQAVGGRAGPSGCVERLELGGALSRRPCPASDGPSKASIARNARPSPLPTMPSYPAGARTRLGASAWQIKGWVMVSPLISLPRKRPMTARRSRKQHSVRECAMPTIAEPRQQGCPGAVASMGISASLGAARGQEGLRTR